MSEETFRWAVTCGVLISTLCILILAIAGMAILRVISRLQARMVSLAGRFEPIIDTSRKVAEDMAPKISLIGTKATEIAANAKDISDVARDQAHRFAEVGRDIADRTKAQVARVDAAVDETVENVQHAGENVKAAVLKPVKEATAVLAGVKAAVAAYGHGRRPSIDHIPQDEEMFI